MGENFKPLLKTDRNGENVLIPYAPLSVQRDCDDNNEIFVGTRKITHSLRLPSFSWDILSEVMRLEQSRATEDN